MWKIDVGHYIKKGINNILKSIAILKLKISQIKRAGGGFDLFYKIFFESKFNACPNIAWLAW